MGALDEGMSETRRTFYRFDLFRILARMKWMIRFLRIVAAGGGKDYVEKALVRKRHNLKDRAGTRLIQVVAPTNASFLLKRWLPAVL